MSQYEEAGPNTEQVRCWRCDKELELMRVTAIYLKSEFPTRVLACPQCQQVYVPEDLALGKMSEIEQTLEEK